MYTLKLPPTSASITNTPSGLECKKQNKKVVGLKCKQKYTKVILLNVTITILTSLTLFNLFQILMFNAFQRFSIDGVQKSCFQDKGIIGKMLFVYNDLNAINPLS